MSQPQVLYNLQQIDTEIRTKKQRLGEVLKAQKEPASLVAMRERAKAAAEALHEAQARQKDLALELSSLNDKASREEKRLYSGQVTNPKELADLQMEVESLGRRRSALENESLEGLMLVDERKSAKVAIDAELQQAAEAWDASLVDLKAEQQALAVRLNQLLARREQQLPLVEARSLQMYEQLARTKNGLAVAGLKNGKCLGCQLTVSAQISKRANEGRMANCENCGRLVYPL